MMGKHIPTPWKLILYGNEAYPFPFSVHTENGENWITRDGTVSSLANAARIVECVNALEGHNPAALADVVRALDDLLADDALIMIESAAQHYAADGNRHSERLAAKFDILNAALTAFNAPAEPIPDIEETCASIARTAADMGGGDE